MSKTELRPHHGMCMAFFAGKGYSDDFTRNMYSVIEALGRDGAEVTLVNGADAICGSCPNNDRGVCLSGDKAERYDNAVLRLCGYKYGDTLSAGKFRASVRDKIISAGKLSEVCGDCIWSEICSEAVRRRG